MSSGFRFSLLVSLASLLLVAHSAQAQSGAAICNRISSQYNRNDCFAVVGGQRVDTEALRICNRISSDREIVECARGVAGRGVTPEAASICTRISSDREIADCAAAVAGRSIERGAASACNRISSDREIVNCAQAVGDKRYAPEAINNCNQNSSDSDIVNCMRISGRRNYPPPRAQYVNQYTYRRDYRDDYRVSDGTADVTIENLLTEPFVRVFWRPAGQRGGWSMNIVSSPIYVGQKRRVVIPQGRIDLCAEVADGRSIWWDNKNLTDDGLALWAERVVPDSTIDCHYRRLR